MKVTLPKTEPFKMIDTYATPIEISPYDEIEVNVNIYSEDVIEAMRYYTSYLSGEYTLNGNRIVCNDGNVFLLVPLYYIDLDIPHTHAGMTTIDLDERHHYSVPLVLVKRTAKTEELFTL